MPALNHNLPVARRMRSNPDVEQDVAGRQAGRPPHGPVQPASGEPSSSSTSRADNGRGRVTAPRWELTSDWRQTRPGTHIDPPTESDQESRHREHAWALDILAHTAYNAGNSRRDELRPSPPSALRISLRDRANDIMEFRLNNHQALAYHHAQAAAHRRQVSRAPNPGACNSSTNPECTGGIPGTPCRVYGSQGHPIPQASYRKALGNAQFGTRHSHHMAPLSTQDPLSGSNTQTSHRGGLRTQAYRQVLPAPPAQRHGQQTPLPRTQNDDDPPQTLAVFSLRAVPTAFPGRQLSEREDVPQPPNNQRIVPDAIPAADYHASQLPSGQPGYTHEATATSTTDADAKNRGPLDCSANLAQVPLPLFGLEESGRENDCGYLLGLLRCPGCSPSADRRPGTVEPPKLPSSNPCSESAPPLPAAGSQVEKEGYRPMRAVLERKRGGTSPNDSGYSSMRSRRDSSSSDSGPDSGSLEDRVPSRQQEAGSTDRIPFSANYRGSHSAKNAGVPHLPDDQNCCLWLYNMAPNLTFKELFESLRGTGRIFSAHINQSDGKKFETAAAKVCFFEPGAAARCMRMLKEGVVTIRGYTTQGRYNRIKIPQHEYRSYVSRVLLITGDGAYVNQRCLTRYLGKFIDFGTDEVIVVDDEHRDTVTVEFRFASWSNQAQAVKACLEKEKPVWLQRVEYQRDPCEINEGEGDDDETAERGWRCINKGRGM
ncbi:hypothetical protein GMORB2_7306 [Geosmithia morbida]|uniref:RRM domain-containing protein n=1 Tax=Geosmithia morbida TaxID=1094350 RepID=A0A9P5D5B2_9HYPO|nr:uncharacterized protein GMORB2_7306 [Geosmithia morbida]KAF4122314.1 hypothetical protein GMORB2_7306 [Geosmithia morbida]